MMREAKYNQQIKRINKKKIRGFIKSTSEEDLPLIWNKKAYRTYGLDAWNFGGFCPIKYSDESLEYFLIKVYNHWYENWRKPNLPKEGKTQKFLQNKELSNMTNRKIFNKFKNYMYK